MKKTRAKKTHCKRGHEFTKENTRIQMVEGTPRRICKACKREWANKNYQDHEKVENPRTNQNDGKTHCIRGHELSGDNLVLKKNKDGSVSRICRICRNAEAREISRAAEAKYRKAQKEDPILYKKTRRMRRAKQLRYIGWTIDLFDATWARQDGKCAICRKELNLDVKHNGAKAHADHEHVEPPKPREILCGNCNLGLGNFQDNPDLLRVAAAYVEKHK